MSDLYQPIAELLAGVRARWRRVLLYRGLTRAALASAAVLLLTVIVARWLAANPAWQAGFGAAVVVAVAVAIWYGLRGVREVPSDARIARFVEERHAELDERLVSAVGV